MIPQIVLALNIITVVMVAIGGKIGALTIIVH